MSVRYKRICGVRVPKELVVLGTARMFSNKARYMLSLHPASDPRGCEVTGDPTDMNQAAYDAVAANVVALIHMGQKAKWNADGATEAWADRKIAKFRDDLQSAINLRQAVYPTRSEVVETEAEVAGQGGAPLNIEYRDEQPQSGLPPGWAALAVLALFASVVWAAAWAAVHIEDRQSAKVMEARIDALAAEVRALKEAK